MKSMKRWYRVTVEADFVVRDVSPEAIRNKLRHIIVREGFEQRNFEIEIQRIKENIKQISSES